MNNLMTVSQIIRSASTIYIYTSDEDSERSSLLPIQLILDGKLYLGVSTAKPIYKQMLEYCDTALVTKIDHEYAADSYFPNLDKDEEWEITAESDEQYYFDTTYAFCKYERKNKSL